MDRIALRHGTAAPNPNMLVDFEAGICTSERALYLRIDNAVYKVGSFDSASGSFPLIRITAQTAAADAANGSIFEGGDGALYYKNLGGETVKLSNEPAPTE